MYRQILSKLGKRTWFPEVPSNWVPSATKSIAECYYPREDFALMTPGCVDDDDDDVKFQSNKMYQHFKSLTPKYSNSILNAATNVVFEKGKPFDVVSWLSTNVSKDKDKDRDNEEGCYLIRNNGDVVPVESLRGKRILVCGLLIPFFWNSDAARIIRPLPYACLLENYELVIVPKVLVDDNMDDGDFAEDAFNHFISGLPSSALIVPFSDTLRRDFLCKSLNLVKYSEYFLVGDDQKLNCGSKISCLKMDARCWWKVHFNKLDDILDCKPSDFVYNIAGDNKIPISQLNEKVVGIYLCVDGAYARPFNLIYQECKARNLDFEIVVVFIPYFYCTGPELFKDAMIGLFHELNISTWWLPPFNHLVSYKLWRAYLEQWDDQLIIVGPHNKFVEPYGRQIMDFGVDAYPFRRELLLAKEVEAYRALSLESLLSNGSDDDHLLLKSKSFGRYVPGYNNLNKIPMSELHGKTVILYADSLESLEFRMYFRVLKWYSHFKKTIKPPHDFEVVFCNLDGEDLMTSRCVSMMPWLFCTLDPGQAFVMEETLDPSPIVAAFGKDGKIISFRAGELLESYGPDDISSYDGLRNELSEKISYSMTSDTSTPMPMYDIVEAA